MTLEVELCPACNREMPPNNKFCSMNCYRFHNNLIDEEEFKKHFYDTARWH